jgi:hypothetical protein
MGSYIDFSITDRGQLQNWILEELGHPLITVELTTTQLNNAINSALELYTEYADMQEDYIMVPLSGYEEGVGLSLSGHNVRAIFTMDEGLTAGVNQLFSVENQMLNNGTFPVKWGGQGSFLTYELASQFMDMARRMLCQKFDFNFNVRTQTLKLFPDPIQQNKGGYVVLGVKTVPAEEDLVGEHYVKRLALAKAKMILGMVRKKFEGVQLPGGGTIDVTVGDDGKEEWTAAYDEIITRIGPHSAWYIG